MRRYTVDDVMKGNYHSGGTMSEIAEHDAECEAIEREIERLNKHIYHLRNALAVIGTAGGTVNEELGISCNGSWCKQQALAALDAKHVPWLVSGS